MKYKGKNYKTIIWDWRSTLYDPNTEQLYPWVMDFLKEIRIDNILVSWAASPANRKEMIKSFRISKYFSKIIVTGTNKREEFERLFDLEGIDPESTIVVGDNMNDEIALANDLGVDNEEVSVFIKNLGLAK